jgi:hypothetical protein
MIFGKHATWVNDLEYHAVLQKMRKLLQTEVLQSRDVMFLPEYDINLLSDHTTAYEFRLDQEKYPLDEIFATLPHYRGIQG